MAPETNAYGFGGRLTADFPSQVLIDCTEICNLACIHCPHPTFKQSEHYAARNLDPQLSAKAVDEVRDYGQGRTQYIRFTGDGEPLFHRHLFDMLAYAVRESGTTVSLTTNGTHLDAGKTERLLATGVQVVDISIDAHTPETYARVRVNGDLTVTRPNVLRLIRRARESASATRVVVSYVEGPDNAHETAEFERFWRDNGASYVVVRRLHSCAGAKGLIALTMRARNESEERRPCLYPWERVVLNPRGHLSFCPADWTRSSTVADYRTTTIKESWSGPFYQKLRAAHLTNDYENHQFCGQCPDWAAVRWPHEGRSYASMIEDFKASA